MALKSTERRVDELELNKQDNLVSGVNIKTINGNSVLGSGNLTVGGGGSATWGGITGTLSSQTDLQSALDAKQDDLISGTNIKTLEGQSLLGAGNIDLTKSDVGLSNVDNTSDLNKPISTATQTALNAKEDTITAGTTSQYFRGDKTFQTLDKTAVGLGNVDNTSDLNKPISTATQTALNAKQDTLTLTTTGTSGAATLVGSTLNIPQYSGGSSSGIHAFVGLQSGASIGASVSCVGLASTSTIGNRLYSYPFIPNQNITTSAFYINVTTSVASGLARILIYSNLNGIPDQKLYESTDLNCATTGIKTATTTFNFVAGTTYWIAFQSNSSFAVSHLQPSALIPLDISGTSLRNHVFAAPSFGFAPTTFSITGYSTTSPPFVGITKA